MSEVKSKERMKDQNRDQTERENEEGNCCEEIFIDRREFFSLVFFLFIPSSLHHILLASCPSKNVQHDDVIVKEEWLQSQFWCMVNWWQMATSEEQEQSQLTILVRTFLVGSRTESAFKRSSLDDKATITVKYLSGTSNQLSSSKKANEEEDEIGEEENQEGESDIELNWDQVEYQLMDDTNNIEQDEEESDFFQEIHSASMNKNRSSNSDLIRGGGTNQHSYSRLDSSVDPVVWSQEVDRVVPQLRLTIRSSDQKVDWRLHLAQLNHNRRQLIDHLEGTKSSLHKMLSSISKDMEKVASREKYIQDQFEPLINEYISIKKRLEELNESYKTASSGVTSKSKILSDISDELESIKAEMEERGSTMTDGAPLVSLRKGLANLRSEVTSLDIRIGVAAHTILQAHLEEGGMTLDHLMQTRKDSFVG